jgi:uncharacterized membrane protein
LVGLGALDVMFLLPLLMGVLGALFGILVAVVTLFVAGGFVFAAGPLTGPPGGPLTAFLTGVGLMGVRHLPGRAADAGHRRGWFNVGGLVRPPSLPAA